MSVILLMHTRLYALLQRSTIYARLSMLCIVRIDLYRVQSEVEYGTRNRGLGIASLDFNFNSNFYISPRI